MEKKPAKPGAGGKIAQAEDKAKHGPKDPAALTAAAGARKYGAEKMGAFAKEGRDRVAENVTPNTDLHLKADKVHGLLQRASGGPAAPALPLASPNMHTHPEYGSMTHGHEGGLTPHGHDFNGMKH